jgi:hypothetical protein
MAIKRATVACIVCMDHLFLIERVSAGITLAPTPRAAKARLARRASFR